MVTKHYYLGSRVLPEISAEKINSNSMDIFFNELNMIAEQYLGILSDFNKVSFMYSGDYALGKKISHKFPEKVNMEFKALELSKWIKMDVGPDDASWFACTQAIGGGVFHG